MNFNQIYNKYNKMIHHLLHKYHIRYNYDEYEQLLSIKLWQLYQNYDPSKNDNEARYYYHFLNFYLIDLLRKQYREPLLEDIYDSTLNLPEPYSFNHAEFNAFIDQLSIEEKQWLILRSQGYKLHEIAKFMHKSPNTLRKYKRLSQLKYQAFFNERT
ncbi:sigma-70 family RNA polymerase sigma factor [Staphylococcus massiliensis]|uniref:Putative DNA-binding protein n=1 Tax=Staphylococcus massiliensis S46 TaxID=1229783 RepID=K9AS96_9STAP|nr:sigma-70 family RNA polymerase sigma factor [Staphylococcus massiliensis]EKU50288.1 putative DNA-binding protein [Staphylococcus massiliensis S46]MCG3399686.1 sigma-70 family RNA polymerase sigma factor [Staphylococcus massiliensis]MCG3400791.1 sigma-70 family RNA polymerase sigma factor [Staphylococcus massiliensis]MCG3412045.1 sigma-70 family RNA polymerase sigma factor [Staphylococcus massiliensis]PNZ98646.1 sigma-70 family RNA polymerase sigma factor [Staphylococcus massiliensis CCUG 55